MSKKEDRTCNICHTKLTKVYYPNHYTFRCHKCDERIREFQEYIVKEEHKKYTGE